MHDVVIIGAGASGLMCASYLKMKDKSMKVLLLERNDKVGKKLLITGNGKCNLGNMNSDIKNYFSSSNLNYLKKELEEKKYINYLKDIGIYIKEENGLLYPYSKQAIGVVKAFERFLYSKGANIMYNFLVTSIKQKDDYYLINDEIKAKSIVIATGGLSYPKTGSDGAGYNLIKNYHGVSRLYPSLVPIICNYRYLKDLKGVRFDGDLSLIVDNEVVMKQTGQVQFTEYGLSGICVFNLSRNIKEYKEQNKNVFISINLIPEEKEEDIIHLLKNLQNYKLQDALSNIVNNKIAFVISKELGAYDKKVCDVNINDVINKLQNLKMEVVDTKGYDQSQVTKGGFIIDEFTNDLESKYLKGLFVIGECLDVDCMCGGYNLSWAFTSAFVAANKILKK